MAECGTDLSRWRTAQHFTSWLTLAPGCRISGGRCCQLILARPRIESPPT
nr:IS110 family transposase [Aeromonas salmonicida]